MITIIHGDDTASSRKYFIEIKEKTTDPVSFDGEKLTLSDLIQVIDGSGLFSDNKNIFIDDFLAKKRQSRELEKITEYLKNNSKDNNIYFWEGKELSKKMLLSLGNIDNKIFKLPQQLFNFLDSIKPKTSKNILYFHEALKTTNAELIFYMLIRQFRLLIAISDINSKITQQIDEIKRLSSWQESKIKRQSYLFDIDDLKTIYKKLYEIDLGQKTGSLNMTLEQAIDILLLEI